MNSDRMAQLENAKRAVVTVSDSPGNVNDTEPRTAVTAAHYGTTMVIVFSFGVRSLPLLPLSRRLGFGLRFACSP